VWAGRDHAGFALLDFAHPSFDVVEEGIEPPCARAKRQVVESRDAAGALLLDRRTDPLEPDLLKAPARTGGTDARTEIGLPMAGRARESARASLVVDPRQVAAAEVAATWARLAQGALHLPNRRNWKKAAAHPLTREAWPRS
jgi:hypothetical protein